jgi:hypothetical protein
MQDRVVWCPVGKSRAVGLHMSLAKLQLKFSQHNPPIHNILSTEAQLSISQKALGTLPEDGNVMQKHVGDTIHN